MAVTSDTDLVNGTRRIPQATSKRYPRIRRCSGVTAIPNDCCVLSGVAIVDYVKDARTKLGRVIIRCPYKRRSQTMSRSAGFSALSDVVCIRFGMVIVITRVDASTELG